MPYFQLPRLDALAGVGCPRSPGRPRKTQIVKYHYLGKLHPTLWKPLNVLGRGLVDAVGIEPTTCRLRAVEFADPPAAIGCYKLLSFVHFADSPLPANRYPYIPDYALF